MRNHTTEPTGDDPGGAPRRRWTAGAAAVVAVMVVVVGATCSTATTALDTAADHDDPKPADDFGTGDDAAPADHDIGCSDDSARSRRQPPRRTSRRRSR